MLCRSSRLLRCQHQAAMQPRQAPLRPSRLLCRARAFPPITPEIAKLLGRQNALASRDMSEADELEYRENGRRIQELSA